MSAPESGTITVRIARDQLYIDADSYARRLAPVANVALLRNEDDLLILPLHGQDSGGFYIKQVNARGDRAVHAADFLRLNGIDETIELRLVAAWDGRLAAYAIRAIFGSGGAARGGK